MSRINSRYDFSSLMGLTHLCITSVGERLNNFRILVGRHFMPEITRAGVIGSWAECAYFPGISFPENMLKFRK